MTNKIVLLDYSSETNAGDAAMQEGLLQLTRRHFPSSSLSVTVAFGANQDYASHFPALLGHPDVNTGGALRPTFYPPAKKSANMPAVEALNTAGLMAAFLWLSLLPINRRWARSVLPASFRRTYDMLDGADLVIWKGKNFRGRGNPFLEFYRVCSRLMMPVAAVMMRKPMAAVGMSLWPLRHAPSRALLRYVFRHCIHVSARESASLAAMRELLEPAASRPGLSLSPDLSFAILGKMHGKAVRERDEVRQVAFTLVDWTGAGRAARGRYIRAVCGLMEFVTREYNAAIIIAPQVTKTWESTDRLLNEIRRAVPPEVGRNMEIVADLEPGAGNLADIYRNADYLVSTRMHAAIFALSVGTPVIAIPYDCGAKWNILVDLGYSDYLIPYHEVNAVNLRGKFMDLRRNEATVMKHVEAKIREACLRVDDCLAEIKPCLD